MSCPPGLTREKRSFLTLGCQGYASIAQLAERSLGKTEVSGPNPDGSSFYAVDFFSVGGGIFVDKFIVVSVCSEMENIC